MFPKREGVHSLVNFNLNKISFTLLTLYTYLLLEVESKSKTKATPFIDSNTHDVVHITDLSFKHRIEQKRGTHYSFVMLCSTKSASTGCKETVQGKWNEIAKEIKGIALIGAVDCFSDSALCRKIHPDNKADLDSPIVVVFPITPIPSYVFEGEISLVAIKRIVSQYYPYDKVTKVTQENVNNFLSTNQQLPKAIFFSNKSGVPILLKVLSHDFDGTISIGFVSSNETALIKRWKIKEYPSLRVIKQDKKQEAYNGTIWNHPALFDWLNVFSEKFVMKNTVGTNNIDPKPWKHDRIPEFTEASYQHICFKGSKGICVIYLKNGGPLEEKEIQMLEGLKRHYESNLSDRGTEFRWMWLNIEQNPSFGQLFGAHEYPSLVVVNPYKRKRFFGLPSDVPATEESVRDILDKVIGGDARFTPIKELPSFATTTKSPREEL